MTYQDNPYEYLKYHLGKRFADLMKERFGFNVYTAR